MRTLASSVAAHAVLTAQRGATIPFRITHFALPLAAFVALMLLFASTSIDVNLAHAWAYDDALQVWVGRRHWWADVLLHRDGRDAILLVILALLGTLATGFFSARARAARRTAAYVLVTIALSWGLIGVLKHVTNVACPWDLQDFGGQRPHVALFETRPLGFVPAACFPGHIQRPDSRFSRSISHSGIVDPGRPGWRSGSRWPSAPCSLLVRKHAVRISCPTTSAVRSSPGSSR